MCGDESASTIEMILSRRSIRGGFTEQIVPRGIVNQILECGIRAPSSKNAQPWKFHVVTSQEICKNIAEHVESAKGFDEFVPCDPKTGKPRKEFSSSVIESASILRTAPLAIFVENRGFFSNTRTETEEALRRGNDTELIGLCMEYIGLGMAIENMLLAARAQGLSGVFMGDVLIAEEFIQGKLGMKGDLAGVICLGYSTQEPDPKKLKKDNVVWHK